MRKLGNSKLVYNRKKRTFGEEKINQLKRLLRWLAYTKESTIVEKEKYSHRFSLRVGEVARINGISCEYLGSGTFATNTRLLFPKGKINER